MENKNKDFRAEQENNYFWAMATRQISPQGISVKMALIVIIAVTFISFLPTFSNGYVLWDDPQYILDNPLMNAPLKVIFSSQGYYLANYHPLTILVYTLEHKFFGVDMMGYHAVSLLFHIANSVLVFFFIYYLLSKKNVMIPLVTALLFGVHPMHVESVAWASELKDVMYTFFFLASLICYVLYLQKGRQLKYLGYALALYLVSLLSKGQAVTLPLCFLLVDFLFKRKISTGMVSEKIPFFILSAIFGVVALKAQGSAIVYNYSDVFHTFFWGFYALCLYLIKFILPINLSGLYPYPSTPERTMPLIVHLAPVIVAVLVFVIYKLFRKNRFVLFGLLFFFANIVTVLKFIPVADAIIADRYSYIPYIGLFFIVGYGFNKLLNNPAYQPRKKIIQYGGIALLVVLSSLTWARTMVWKDSFSFWGDAIKKDSGYWRAYYCLGQESYNKGDYPAAINYFSEAIENDKYSPPLVYMWRGTTYIEKTHNMDGAIADFKKVLDFGNKKDPSQLEGRLDLGLAYYRKGMYDDALRIYTELINMAPDETAAYFQRALVYQYSNKVQPQLALADYSKAIDMNPNYVDAYLNRGSLYVDQLSEYDLGIADFNKVLEINPNNIDAGTNKGIAYYRKGDYEEALNSYNQVIQKTGNSGRVYFLEALVYGAEKNYVKALQAAQLAQNTGAKVDQEMIKRWESESGQKQ
jgi:protein O-mannosyl-transferase